MSIFQFISQEQIDALPHDEPVRAFLEYSRIAQSQFFETMRRNDENLDHNEYRFDFQNATLTFARSFGIAELADYEMSDPGKEYSYEEFRRFEVALNRVVAGLVVEAARRPRFGSVFVPQSAR